MCLCIRMCVVGDWDQLMESDKILLTCRQAAGQTSVTLTRDERGRERRRRNISGERWNIFLYHATLTLTHPSQVHRSGNMDNRGLFCGTQACLQPLHSGFLSCPCSHIVTRINIPHPFSTSGSFRTSCKKW